MEDPTLGFSAERTYTFLFWLVHPLFPERDTLGIRVICRVHLASLAKFFAKRMSSKPVRCQGTASSKVLLHVQSKRKNFVFEEN